MRGRRLESPRTWAQREFGAVVLRDRRLQRRLVRVATAAARRPGATTLGRSTQSRQAKGAYRLFGHRQVTHGALCGPHWCRTREMAGEPMTTLMISDTSELDFTSHRATTGLGPIGDGVGRGVILHSVLAVEPIGSGRVLGLAHQRVFIRKPAPEGEKRSAAARRKRGTEARHWPRAVHAVGDPPPGRRWVHVGDRYADMWPQLDACTRGGGRGFLIRAAQDRCVARGHEASEKQMGLMALARTLPALGGNALPIKGRAGRAGRVARLLLAAAPVTIFAPLARRGARRVRCWVVRVWEVDAPRAAEPIEWVLLSSLPVEDLESAREKAGWYAMRWLVEEFHKCLKTGCAVEKSQLATRARLEPQVGMLSVLAVRLLQAKEYARHQPDQPASVCVEEPYVRMMAAYLRTKPATLTIRRFIHAVASLGGFMGRSGDGEPGWQTIWEGWRQLELMLAGARIGLPDG